MGALTLAVAAVLAAEQPSLGVFDFVGAPASAVAAANGIVANEVGRLHLFKLTTSDSLRSLLALERQKQLLGCSDSAGSCMQEIVGALGLDYIITGRLSNVGGTLSLELTLLEVRAARRDGSEIVTASNDAELVAKVPAAIPRLLAHALERYSGSLLVSVTEKGALIKIDDEPRGTTPVDGALKVPGGTHRLTVEKESFVTWQGEVRIQQSQLTEQAVTLTPSADYISRYESSAKRMRLGAFISVGAAAVGAGATAAFYVLMSSAYREFQVHKASLQMGIEIEGKVDHRAEAERLSGVVSFDRTLAFVSAGVAGAAAALAAFFFIAGDSPAKYEKFHGVVAVLTPLGAGVYCSW